MRINKREPFSAYRAFTVSAGVLCLLITSTGRIHAQTHPPCSSSVSTNCGSAGYFRDGYADGNGVCQGGWSVFSASANAVSATFTTITQDTSCNLTTNGQDDTIVDVNYTWSINTSPPTNGTGQTVSARLAPGVWECKFTARASNAVCGVVSTNLMATGVVARVNIVPANGWKACAGKSKKFLAIGTPSGGTFTWSPGGGHGNSTNYIFSDTGTNSVSVTYCEPLKGTCCWTQSVGVVYGIGINPETFVTCVGVTNTFTANGAPDGGSYSWSPAGVVSADGKTNRVVFTSPNENQSVSVTYGSCSTSATGRVQQVKIDIFELNDTTKVDPGALRGVNLDDDNNNGTNDVNEIDYDTGFFGQVSGEDDLLPITLTASAVPADQTVTLSTPFASWGWWWDWPGCGGIRLWKSPQRGPDGPVLDNTSWPPRLSTNWPASAFPVTLYLEGVSASATNADVVLYLSTPTSCTDSAKVTVLNIDLDVDTDRNGAIDDADEEGKDKWTVQRGAFVTPDAWLADDTLLLPKAQVASLARVVIQPLGVVPPGIEIKLRLEGNTAARLVTTNMDSGGNVIKVGPGSGATTIEPSLIASNQLVLFAAATNDLSAFADGSGHPDTNASLVRVTLTAAAGGSTFSNRVVMQVAPIILGWNSLQLEWLYCAPQFPMTVCPGKLRPKPSSHVWIQDIMELGNSRFSSVVSLNQVADLQHSREGSNQYIRQNLLPEGNDYSNPCLAWHKTTWSNNGNGGNIEVFPPYTGLDGVHHPFGRIMMLPEETASCLNKIQAQGIQDPIELSAYDHWLAVGHIDELFCFLSDVGMLMAHPGRAWEAIIDIINTPGMEKTIRVGTAHWDQAVQDVTSDENFFFSQTKPLEHFLETSDTTIHVSGVYQAEDFLLIDREVLKVVAVTDHADHSDLIVERGQDFGNTAQSHTIGAKIRKLSPDFKTNVYDPSDTEGSLHTRITKLGEQLEQKLGKPVTGVKIPVVFDVAPGSGNRFVATSANMVNCVVDGSAIYATDPSNARFRELLQSFVSQTVHWEGATAWNNFHILDGELHCGSNAKRTFPAADWWNFPECENWGK